MTAEQLRAILDYDPATGILTWRHRSDRALAWNRKWAGEKAGTVSRGRISVVVGSKHYAAHRLAWLLVTGEWPPSGIDHVNGDATDNRIANLRLANQTQNNGNKRVSKNNKSGLKGTHREKKNGRWVAQIMCQGKNYHLGRFGSAEAAHKAYCDAADRLFGEFARYN